MKFTWNRVFHCEGSKHDIRLLDTLGWMSKDRWFFPNKAIVCDVIWFLFLDPPRKLIDTSNCILLISVMRIVMLLLNPFWINSNLEARPHRVYLHGRPHLNLLFYFGFVSLGKSLWCNTETKAQKTARLSNLNGILESSSVDCKKEKKKPKPIGQELKKNQVDVISRVETYVCFIPLRNC